MRILGIETSCDETAASIIKGKDFKIKVLSTVVSSQINLHKKYGGVVPEVASRAHAETIIPVLESALEKARILLDNIDAIGITIGPGLVGSLVCGTTLAKTSGYLTKKPIVAINHVEGHIYSNFIENSNIKLPAMCLVVSGGHTSLIFLEKIGKHKTIGKTVDDAAGEAFDKVAKLLNLGYPGGPIIGKIAQKGDSAAFDFPRIDLTPPPARDKEGYLRPAKPSFDFSFSGVKTAVLDQVKRQKKLSQKIKTDIAASFEQAVVDVLCDKTIKAAQKYKARTVLLAGGVAANKKLRKELDALVKKSLPNVGFYAPPLLYCTDNATMIAAAAYFMVKSKQKFTPWQKIKSDSNLEI